MWMSRVLLVLFIAVLGEGTAIGLVDGMSGHWSGAFRRSGKAFPFGLQITSQDPFAGTVTAPLNGIAGVPISGAGLSGEQFSFRVDAEGGAWDARMQVKNGRMNGQIKAAEWSSELELVKLAEIDPERYFGVYRFAESDYLYVRSWDEAGERQLVSFDDAGLVRPLYPTSETDFFAGSGLMIPLPKSAQVRFVFAGNRVTGLQWLEDGVERKKASRVAEITEEEVTFGVPGTSLSGTLIAPASKGPWAAIVFVHGSGPVTRNYIGPLPYVFARHGIAALIYDKRGIGKSQGHWLDAGFEELAADALAAVGYLKSRGDVDASRIGMLGVSQGGWILPLAASQSDTVKFLISISGAGVNPMEQQIQMTAQEMRVAGTAPEEIERAIALTKEQLNQLRSKETEDWARAEVQKLENEGRGDLLASSGLSNPKFVQFYRSILDFDPLPFWEKVRCPVLAIYGERDTMVPPGENRDRVAAALQRAGIPAAVETIPKADHVLMASETGSMGEFPYHDRFAPEFLPRVIAWALEQKGPGSR